MGILFPSDLRDREEGQAYVCPWSCLLGTLHLGSGHNCGLCSWSLWSWELAGKLPGRWPGPKQAEWVCQEEPGALLK